MRLLIAEKQKAPHRSEGRASAGPHTGLFSSCYENRQKPIFGPNYKGTTKSLYNNYLGGEKPLNIEYLLTHASSGGAKPSSIGTLYSLQGTQFNSGHILFNSTELLMNSTEPLFNSSQPFMNSLEPSMNSSEALFNSSQPFMNSLKPSMNSLEPFMNSYRNTTI